VTKVRGESGKKISCCNCAVVMAASVARRAARAATPHPDRVNIQAAAIVAYFQQT